MASNSRGLRSFCLVLCVLSLLGGCEDDVPRSSTRGSGAGSKAAAAAAANTEAADEPSGMVLKDDDFVESERNRDPFRAYAAAFGVRGADSGDTESQRRVIMPTTAVEEMRLIAIISGMPRPKAMLVDTLNVGYVVERGDYVGRPKVIQTAGSVSMTLNWRIDRIRDNELVMTRQDPTDPTRPPLSRVMALRDEVAAR